MRDKRTPKDVCGEATIQRPNQRNVERLLISLAFLIPSYHWVLLLINRKILITINLMCLVGQRSVNKNKERKGKLKYIFSFK